MNAILHKLAQLVRDPVLRRWIWLRITGREVKPAPRSRMHPPYLMGLSLEQKYQDHMQASGVASPNISPMAPITLSLAGEDIVVASGEESGLFDRTFSDLETQLSLYRFAWLPLQPECAKEWVATLWHSFSKRFAQPDDAWAWHPYTAAERAINLIDYVARMGNFINPEAWRDNLICHAQAIFGRLEYFGEENTGNHLANNGRGLFRIGLALNWELCIEIGARILQEEARRIFTPSGFLREGSSHYHLLLTRNYADCWLAARRANRPEAEILAQTVSLLITAAQKLALPGGMPLVGDVSPDCPPSFLEGVIPGANNVGGWIDLLSSADKETLQKLHDSVAANTKDNFCQDGWLRWQGYGWSGLWYLSPEGWSFMPGHGHQDAGSFVVQYYGTPLFVDPGRGQYGEEGEAAYYRSSHVHNTLTVDDADPYPTNKPYYSEYFRRAVGGAIPSCELLENGVTLSHQGYGRIGATRVSRDWKFAPQMFSLDDKVDGKGRHLIRRRLLTPWPVAIQADGVHLVANKQEFRIRTEQISQISTEDIKLWSAYGRSEKGTAIVFTSSPTLPWNDRLIVEAI